MAMFGKSKDSSQKNNVGSQRPIRSGGGDLNAILRGTVIVGNLNAEGDMRIDGKVVGTLVCNSRLVVTETGYVEGSIDAQNAKVAGEIHGNVVVREVLEVDGTGRVYGDIVTQKLVMHIGGVFTGNCKMEEAAKSTLAKTQPKPGELIEKSSSRLSKKQTSSASNQQASKAS